MSFIHEGMEQIQCGMNLIRDGMASFTDRMDIFCHGSTPFFEGMTLFTDRMDSFCHGTTPFTDMHLKSDTKNKRTG